MNLGSILKLIFDFVMAGLVFFAFWAYLGEKKKNRTLVQTDSLTGAFNLNRFTEILQMEIARSQRTGRNFCLAYVDLDNFRRVNELHGHSAGNEVLRTAVRLVLDKIRRLDCIGRLGGDEFVILLPESDKAAGLTVLQRVQQGFFEAMAAKAFPVGMSIGLCVFKSAPASADAALKFAGEVILGVKAAGKNSIHCSEFYQEA